MTRQSRATILRDQIEQDIVTGVFAPGERLDEALLAARFSVSRTPIREALMQLAAMDLVNIQPHRGAFVNVISIPEMLGMFEVMAELEGMCARLVARRRTTAHLANLEAAQTACLTALETGEADDYYYANEQFHTALYHASGNPFLARTATSLHGRLKPFRRLQLRVPGRMHSSAAEHDAIIAALRAGDGKEAERLTESHISVQGDRFSDFLSSLETEERLADQRRAKA